MLLPLTVRYLDSSAWDGEILDHQLFIWRLFAPIRREIKHTKSDIQLVFLIHTELRCTVNRTSNDIPHLRGTKKWYLVFCKWGTRNPKSCYLRDKMKNEINRHKKSEQCYALWTLSDLLRYPPSMFVTQFSKLDCTVTYFQIKWVYARFPVSQVLAIT